MVHVTNGDRAAEVIRAAGLPGAVLPWRDVLHEGPVPAPATLDSLRPLRARFLAAQGWGEAAAIAGELESRDRAFVRAARSEDEIVLWFEHDLYDQLQLAQVIDALNGARRVTLVQTTEYLGPMKPGALRPLFDARREITDRERRAARLSWNAFSSPDPRDIERVLLEVDALPFMKPALVRHLEEFPSVDDGLSRTERQALEALASGPLRMQELYAAAHHQREDVVFLGDAVFISLMTALARGESALVRIDNDEVTLTSGGVSVLDGRQDRVALAGIDRWLGGVHLRGRRVRFRWDRRARRIVAS